MGHSIQGFIGLEDEINECVLIYKAARVVPLAQGFAFVPMTAALYEEISADSEFAADVADERFLRLSSKVFQLGRKISLKTPVAYVEMDYFGGDGFQRAVAWRDGDFRFGPAVYGREEGVQIDRQTSSPINQALQEIGVSGYLMEDENAMPKDEFEELGLDRYRSNEDLLASKQNRPH